MKYIFLFLILLLTIGVVSADTGIFYTTNSSDGVIYAATTNSSFHTLHLASTGVATTAGVSYAEVISSKGPGLYTQIMRGVFIFNTSSIPSSATTDSSTLSLYRFYSATGLGDTGITPVNFRGEIVAGDYNKFDYIPIATYKNASTLSTSKYYDWSLTNLTPITKEGNTKLGLLTQHDILNINMTWASVAATGFRPYGADNVVNTPYLTVTWTPDTTPPASIANLNNNTANCSSITWAWDNPTEADFSHQLNYKNNVLQTNIGNATTSILWSGLSELTQYTFSSKTVDLIGNINNTWVNRSVTIPACHNYNITNPYLTVYIWKRVS